MITVEDICNKALNYLQANMINSIDENSVEATRCRGVYDTIRDSVLEEAWWQFATFFAQPVLLESEVVPGWSYLYVRPVKCLATRNVFQELGLTIPDTIEFLECISPTTKKRVIATNITDPWMEFTYQVTDPTFYTPKFTECFALKLAAEIGPSINGNDTNAKTALNIYTVQISEAKRMNGSNKKVVSTTEPSYVSSRG